MRFAKRKFDRRARYAYTPAAAAATTATTGEGAPTRRRQPWPDFRSVHHWRTPFCRGNDESKKRRKKHRQKGR